MPGELERLQIIIEADASGVAPAAQAAGNAVERMGQRTQSAVRTAQQAITAYKRAFTEAQRAARLESQRSAAAAAVEKTNREYTAAAQRLRALSRAVDEYEKKGQGGTARALAAQAREEAQAARLANLEGQGQRQADRLAQIEQAQKIQQELAEMTRQRAAEAQAAAQAAAQEGGANTAQAAAAQTAAESNRALAEANKEAAQSAQGARSAAASQAEAAQTTASAAREATQSVRDMRAEVEASRRGTSIFSSIGRAMRSMLFIRSVTGIMRGFVRWLGQAAMANTQFRAAVDSIRGNLISAFAPIYEAIIPWLTSLANALATVTGWLARLSSLIFGPASGSTEAMLSGIGGAAGGAAKQVRSLLAQFDELNVLERENGSGGGGGGGGGSGGFGGNAAGNTKNALDDAWKYAIAAEHPVIAVAGEITEINASIMGALLRGTTQIIKAINPAEARRLIDNAKELTQSVEILQGMQEDGTPKKIRESYELRSRADEARADMRPYDISGYPSMSVDEFESAQKAAGKAKTYQPRSVLKDVWEAILFPNGKPTVEDVLSDAGKEWYRSIQNAFTREGGGKAGSAGGGRKNAVQSALENEVAGYKQSVDQVGKTLRVGAGETAQSVQAVADQFALAEQAARYFGLTGAHTWEEMQGYIARMQQELAATQERAAASEAVLRMSLSEPLMEAQAAAGAVEQEFGTVEQRINAITAASGHMEKAMRDAKARAEEEIAKALALYDAQTGKNAKNRNTLPAGRTDVKAADTRADKYDISAAASAHPQAGTRPLSDIYLDASKDAIQQSTQRERANLVLQVDGRTLGSVVLDNLGQLGRLNGQTALLLK